MRSRNIGMLLMFCAIGLMGYQIGATAKNQNNDLFFLMPIGVVFLLVGMFLWFRDIRKKD